MKKYKPTQDGSAETSNECPIAWISSERWTKKTERIEAAEKALIDAKQKAEIALFDAQLEDEKQKARELSASFPFQVHVRIFWERFLGDSTEYEIKINPKGCQYPILIYDHGRQEPGLHLSILNRIGSISFGEGTDPTKLKWQQCFQRFVEIANDAIARDQRIRAGIYEF